MTLLRRYKRRETLRIAYGDIIRGQRLEMVTAQISYLADAIVEAAVRFARCGWTRNAAAAAAPMAARTLRGAGAGQARRRAS